MDKSNTTRHGKRVSDFAKHDCGSCVAKKRKCDRAKPHCRTCQKSGTNCAGFGLHLSWQPGFSSDCKPVKKTIVRRPRRRNARGSSGVCEIEFINEYMVTGPGANPAPTVTRSPSEKSSSTMPSANHEAVATPEHEALEDCDIATDSEQPPTAIAVDSTADDYSGWPIELDAPTVCTPVCTPDTELYIIHPNIRYDGLLERFGPVFDRYDQEFSVIPLTSDLPFNPFRCYRKSLQQSQYLLHAVLALACHHTNSETKGGTPNSVLEHGRTALQLFRQALSDDDVAATASTLLDTIVVLFSLDEAHSLVGSWGTHLAGAYNILEVIGGIKVWAKSPRMAIQVALLVWWDAVVSLVNRSPCVFPLEYADAVFDDCNDKGWAFFDLCGCPQSIAVLLIQLAHLAAEKQKSFSMRWVSFDNTLVSQIEQSLEDISLSPSDDLFKNEENMHQEMDRWHCSEAWRNGLLLYIHRIFRWRAGDVPLMKLKNHARVILDHACACRDGQFMARQALLPLFFAGCELKDRSSRMSILQLCSAWNQRTRYHLFAGMIPLLERVWEQQSEYGSEYVWWGQVVDEMSSAGNKQRLPTSVCFG